MHLFSVHWHEKLNKLVSIYLFIFFTNFYVQQINLNNKTVLIWCLKFQNCESKKFTWAENSNYHLFWYKKIVSFHLFYRLLLLSQSLVYLHLVVLQFLYHCLGFSEITKGFSFSRPDMLHEKSVN
ncbi:hypothetical protein BpHYR1_019571 [Brachionus plicatilis]|uniref:Uncharacterized protein n=1 Tax=Brachionus plicatilis TaxID=10195 RepID=A0A3M7Q424_BRAPC|nr:hypothetical protein BpHYR1_019571 [Brachionus plicatilis]